MRKLILAATISLLLQANTKAEGFRNESGTFVEMKQRKDMIGVILKSEISEAEAKRVLSPYAGMSSEIKKIMPKICLIEFQEGKSDAEIEQILQTIPQNESVVKIAVHSYYGSSNKVAQIPSDRLIVKLRSNYDKDKLEMLNAEYGCYILGNVNGERGFLLETNSTNNLSTLELSEMFYSRGIFEYVQPDFIYPGGKLLQSIPNDPEFDQQWALHNTGQLLQTGSPFYTYGDAATVTGIPDSDMDVAEAWDITTGSSSIKIGIIDSGIDSAHADLQAPGHLLPGYDAFTNTNGSSVDYFNHGTSVAGIIGAVMNNSTGIAGIAPGCRLMSICIFDNNGSTSTSIITRAFDTAVARGIDVLSNSWGGGLPEPAITDAINNAALNGRGGLGSAILFASGNDGNNPPIYPSVLPNVLSVGGSTPHDQKKAPGNGNQFFWGSNYGEDATGDLDVIAPTNCYTIASGGYEPHFWGTSATCPNAAGVAALVLSVNESQSRQEVYSNITKGCDKPGNVPYSVTKTFGKWNEYYGYGRVNAFASVNLALGVDKAPPAINHTNVASHSNTYPTTITAEITDHDGSAVPNAGLLVPRVHYTIKKSTGSWSAYDSSTAYQKVGNTFYFKIPSLGWESEVQYFIRAYDNAGNRVEFPRHAPAPMNVCYYAVGSITSETIKIPAFSGVDYGGTVSPATNFSAFKILDAKIKVHMRHTYLGDELFQIYAPISDPNYNRICVFSCNGNDMDNIYGAMVSDSASLSWKNGQPPYLNGHYKPEFSLRGLRGQGAGGAWRVIHFDRGIGDYAFFDSVKVTLYRTTGAKSPSARLNSPDDSTLLFDNSSFPGIYDKDFYLKNSGTSNLAISAYSFSGQRASMYSLLNTPPATVAAGDSALFRIRLNTTVGSSAVSQALLNISTNDPFKSSFKVSMLTNDSLKTGLKNLQLTALIQGLYNPVTNTSRQDTITVFLRRFTSPYAIVDSTKGVLTSAGTGSFSFRNVQNGLSYYIVVTHRNGLETWSSAPLTFSGIQSSYNFTNSVSAAYGNNLALVGSRYCIYSGDIDADRIIDGDDVVSADNAASSYLIGYVPQDINGDGFVDATDIDITNNNSEDFITVIRP